MQTGPPRETHRPLALGGGLARALYGSVDRAAASSTSPLRFFAKRGESRPRTRRRRPYGQPQIASQMPKNVTCGHTASGRGDMVRDILDPIFKWWDAGETFGLATVVRTFSSAPRETDAAMAVAADGEVVGSVSGGCVEGAL